MRAPCEVISRYVLPSIRSIMVNYLYNEKDLTQLEIARKLKISQSSVSRYVNNERGLYREAIEALPGLREMLESVSEKIIGDELDVDMLLCEACIFLREKGYIDKISSLVRRKRRRKA